MEYTQIHTMTVIGFISYHPYLVVLVFGDHADIYMDIRPEYVLNRVMIDLQLTTVTPGNVKLEVESSTEESSAMSRKSAVVNKDGEEVGECCVNRRNRIIAVVVMIFIVILLAGAITAAILLAAGR